MFSLFIDFEKLFKTSNKQTVQKFDLVKAKAEVDELKRKLKRKSGENSFKFIEVKNEASHRHKDQHVQNVQINMEKYREKNQRKETAFWIRKPKIISKIENGTAGKSSKAFIRLLMREDAKIDVSIYILKYFWESSGSGISIYCRQFPKKA